MTTVLIVQGAGEPGGAEAVLATLTAALPAADVTPVVYSMTDGPFLEVLEAAGTRVVRGVSAPRARDLRHFRATCRAIAQAASEAGADVIHGNGEKMGLFASWAGRHARVPTVVWLHDEPMRSLAALAVQLGVRAARPSAYVAPSQWMADAFAQRLKINADVIEHGIDLAVLRESARAATESPPGITSGPVFGHFGRLQRWKGADQFLEAAARVVAQLPAARFLVVGGALYGWERDYADDLPNLAARLGIGDRVHFLGHRDDVPQLMACCDVVVHSSRRPEPFGMVITEAMALGRPVIASPLGAPSELVQHGDTGLLVAPDDVGRLAAAMLRLGSDPQQRDRLGRAAARVAEKRWNVDGMAGHFADLYQRLTVEAVPSQ